MKKIIFSLLCLLGAVSTNAQVVDVYKDGALIATYTNGNGHSYKFVAREYTKVSSITLSENATVYAGSKLTLTATALPDNASVKTVTWSSDNESIATVTSAGVVTGVAVGTTTITCAANDGSGVKATCTVTVSSDIHLLDGKFSVSATKQVQFTKSNLYWDGSAFKFETSPTDYQTSWNANHVSHFYWRSIDEYNSGDMPYSEQYSLNTSRTTEDKFWCGEDNTIDVEGTTGLYALTMSEWNYLINTRTNASSLYKCGVTVHNNSTTYENCLIIAPDNYDYETYTWGSDYTMDWLNSHGLLCLPGAGYRSGTSFYGSNGYGDIWSATPDASYVGEACSLYFGTSIETGSRARSNGYSLRLVR